MRTASYGAHLPTMSILVKNYIISTMIYGMGVWSQHVSKQQKDKLQKTINVAARAALCQPRNCRLEILWRELSINSVLDYEKQHIETLKLRLLNHENDMIREILTYNHATSWAKYTEYNSLNVPIQQSPTKQEQQHATFADEEIKYIDFQAEETVKTDFEICNLLHRTNYIIFTDGSRDDNNGRSGCSAIMYRRKWDKQRQQKIDKRINIWKEKTDEAKRKIPEWELEEQEATSYNIGITTSSIG